MKKKVFSKLLMVALVATVGVFSSCKDYDDDIADVRNNLSQTATELRSDYNSKIELTNQSITKLQTLYNSLDEAYKEADKQLNNLIQTQTAAAVTEAKAYSDANLAAAKDDAAKAAAAAEQAAKDYAKAEAAAAQAAAIAAAKEAVAAAQAELSAALAKANETIATQGENIANLIKAKEELSAAIVAAQTRADQAYALADKANTLAEQNKANLEAAASDIAKLKTDLANLQGTAADKATVSKLQADLEALQKTVETNVVDLASYKESITSVTSELAKLNSDLTTAIGTINESIAAVKATADGNVTAIDALKTQLSTIDAAWQLADQEIIKSINNLAATVDANKSAAEATAEANKAEAASKLQSAVDAITAELAAKQKLIETNDAAIKALLDTKVSELKKLIEGNAKDILANATAISDNKAAQDAANVIMQNNIAQNAKDIVAQGKDITNLDDAIKAIKKALGDDTAETLKAYAKSIAESEALQAKLDAQGYADKKDAAQSLTLMQAIKDQAEQDASAWTAAINLAVENLVTTYKLASLNEYIKQTAEAAQSAAEKNAAEKAQEIANKALADAKTYTDKLAQTLKDNYTTTTDMQTAIENAKKAAISQAYLDVLNTLLRDYDEWYNLNDENKMNLELTPTIIELTKAAVEKYGLTKANAQDLINATIEAGLKKPEGTGTYTAEGKEIMTPAGVIMAEILAAADALQQELDAVDLRVADIEKILGATVVNGDTTLTGKIFAASVNALIATATDQKFADLAEQLEGNAPSGLLTKINAAAAQANQNAIDLQTINAAINNLNTKFTGLTPAADEVKSNLNENYFTAFGENIDKLIARVNKNSAVIDGLGNTVEKYVNKFLAEKVGNMITSINLFANQHMAERDEQYKIAKYNSETGKYEWPYGYDNFDHTLTFAYVTEQGIYENCKLDIKKESWNYPDDLLSQIKAVKSERDDLEWDYDYVFDAGQGFTGDAEKPDFVHGRFRTFEDSILVRVSPTNADLRDAEIALLNSQGENIVDLNIIEVTKVAPYTRPADEYITRFKMVDTRAAANDNPGTGLWVIYFKPKETVISDFKKYAESNGGDIVYAVAVKNTDFSYEDANGNTQDVDRYVVSEYDLSLGLAKTKHAYDFTVNTHPIDSIHNRYITPEQGEINEYNWDDDPENYTESFRYELTWANSPCPDAQQTTPATPGAAPADPIKTWYYAYCWNCCYDKFGNPNEDCKPQTSTTNMESYANTTILFKGDMDTHTATPLEGINTVDRWGHDVNDQGIRKMSGIDNRHLKKPLSVNFDYEMDGAKWAKIDIEFPMADNCGNIKKIRGFFVTLDQHFALESDKSEINAWTDYIYKNVAKYSYNNGKRDDRKTEKIHLFESNTGTIYIKDANNIQDGDVIGFRVHAVNLDGTITDPDGRAFYVMIGSKQTEHALSFDVPADTVASYAVQNKIAAKDKDGNDILVNPIAYFNETMKAAKKSLRFFNNEPYSAQYDPSEVFDIEYTWREGNPAIRSTYFLNLNDLASDATQTVAVTPVAGTGTLLEPLDPATNGTIVTATNIIGTKVDPAYDPEKFFDFYYSLNENADADFTGEANKWVAAKIEHDGNKGYAPNKQTMSMLASIKAGMANHLVDFDPNNADATTYKIKMTIKRRDSKTGYITINTYDIDIRKVMPTQMPEKFSVKTNQLTNGAWDIYVRPMSDGNEAQDAQYNWTNSVRDPWKITWGDFVLGKPADAAKFAELFNADAFKDVKDKDKFIQLHGQRWAVDTRPFNFDEIFNGLHVDVDNQLTFDKNYYFIFAGAGSLPGAKEDKAAGKTWAEADAANANKDAIAVYNQSYTGVVNPGTLDHSLYPAYYLPEIHWSHVGTNDNPGTANVKAGYIYRNISATIDPETGKFLAPGADKKGKFGLSITNDDYEIAPVQVKAGSNDLVAKFYCTFGKAIASTNDAADNNTFAYNDDVLVEAKNCEFKLQTKDGKNKWAVDGGDDRGYFNAMLPITKKDNSDKKTLADMLNTPWLWLDYNSLAVATSAPEGYNVLNYHYEPCFMVGTAKFDPKQHKFNQITSIALNRRGTSSGDGAFTSAVVGTFTFDVYDVWFHKTTVTVKWGKKAPTNQYARQAK